MGELRKELENLPKFALISAAFVTFMASAPEDERRATLHGWIEVLGLSNFELKRF